MKKTVFILAISMVILLGRVSAQGQSGSIPEGVVLALKAGNAEELAKFFNSNVELIILETEDFFSKSQAEQIVRKFFLEHRPENFKIIHEGGQDNSRYAIGSLGTNAGTYRVYFLVKNEDGTPLINQLRIEEEDGNAQ